MYYTLGRIVGVQLVILVITVLFTASNLLGDRIRERI